MLFKSWTTVSCNKTAGNKRFAARLERYTPFMGINITLLFLLGFAFISCQTKNPNSHETNYYPTYTKDLEDSVQTIDLMYIVWGCQCAEWVTEMDYKNALDNGDTLVNKAVFVEPADSLIQFPDTLVNSGDLIRFTGQFYKDKGYPKKYPVTEMQVDKARVFRYSRYEVLRSNYGDIISDPTSKQN